MDAQLVQMLGEIQKCLGSIDGKLDAHMEAFSKHIEDDRAMASNIKQLEMQASRQRGAMTALGAVATILGSAAGYLIEKFTFGHH